MSGTSGFQEVRSSTSRSSTNRFLQVQRHQFGTGFWQLRRTHDLIALSTWVQQTSARRTIGFLVVMQVWLLCLGLESFAQTVSLEALEVTQSIQSMSLSTHSYNNAVPMIANKKTVVRAYFSAVSTTGTVTIASGRLKATPNPCLLGATCELDSVNSSSVDVSSGENGNLPVKRNSIEKSLNFELPPEWTRPGTMTFTLEQVAGPGGTAITCTGCTGSPVIVTFRSSPPLRLRLIGLKYQRNGTWYEPREEDFALIKSWLNRAYPVAMVTELDRHYSPIYGEDLFKDRDGDGSVPDDDACMMANLQIQAIRNSELGPVSWFMGPKGRTHYYGLIDDGGTGSPNFISGCSDHPEHGIPADRPDPSTTAVGPVGPDKYPWDIDGSYGDWYAGHELGHTFGRLHLVAGVCTTNAPNDVDTTVDGRVSPNPPPEPYYVGLDSGDRSISIEPSAITGNAYDIMTYCNPTKWINHYTYEGIRERLALENAPIIVEDIRLERDIPIFDPAGPVVGMRIRQGDFLNILAIVNFKNSTGRIHQVDRTKYIVVRPQTPNKQIQIRVTHINGKVAAYPVEVRVDIDTLPDRRTTGLINTPILFTNNIAKVELVMAGKPIGGLGARESKILDSIKVTKNSPGVDKINLPIFETREAFFKDPWTLTWKAHDTDSKILTYTVQFSMDNGSTWQTLGITLTKPALEIEPKVFKDLINVKIKVIASDGFNKGAKIVTLKIPSKVMAAERGH